MLLLMTLLACEGEDDQVDRDADIAALQGDADNGASLYGPCQGCHAADGTGTDNGPGIVGEPKEHIIEVILYGSGTMPAYDGWPDQDIADVTAYVMSL